MCIRDSNSTLDVADKVMNALVDANLIEKSACKRPNWHKIDVNEVNIVARDIAKARQYPLPMAKVNQRLMVWWIAGLIKKVEKILPFLLSFLLYRD